MKTQSFFVIQWEDSFMSNMPLQPDGHSTDKQKEDGKKGGFEALFKKIGIPLAILVFLISYSFQLLKAWKHKLKRRLQSSPARLFYG